MYNEICSRLSLGRGRLWRTLHSVPDGDRQRGTATPLKPEAMAERIVELYRRWRRDFGFRTVAGAGLSLAATALFAVYNGILGLTHKALWNGSICAYYLLLTALRGYIIAAERLRAPLPQPLRRAAGRRAFSISSAILLGLNLALVVPVTLMSRLQRPVGIGLIPAIATATYATWKITMAAVNFRRRRRSRDLLVRQLRTITLIDALVSILTL